MRGNMLSEGMFADIDALNKIEWGDSYTCSGTIEFPDWANDVATVLWQPNPFLFPETDLERAVLERLRDDENFLMVLSTVMANRELIISIARPE